jgi:hypothetical protein
MPHRKSRTARLYCAALVLYPAGFRREFSAEMICDVDDAVADARRTGGQRAVIALWVSTWTDLAVSVVLQWMCTGLPLVAGCAIVGAIAAAQVAGHLVAYGALIEPVTAADRDLMALILLIGVVMLVIAATIFFTFWFSRPLLTRHRR